MKHWRDELADELAALESASLRRSLRLVEPCGEDHSTGLHVRRNGQGLLNFASNDYLALASHPKLIEAATTATKQYGTGSGASRLVTGHLPAHARLEERFARFKHAEAALLCPTGYLANLAVLTALAGPGDTIYLDKLCHASLIDAARFSGAMVRIFPHLHLEKLERLLARPDAAGLRHAAEQAAPEADADAAIAAPVRRTQPRRFIVTDSVFSMDGDCADLPRLCDLAERHDAILIVDEAHGTGVFGDSGAGLCEEQGVAGRVDVVVSTASKALGGLGGIVTGDRVVIDTLINRARSFIFTTAVPAAQAAAIDAAIDVIRDEPWRRQRVRQLAVAVRRMIRDLGMMNGDGGTSESAEQVPIIPIVTGSAASALALAAHLESQGILAPAIRPPAVAPKAARVRLSLRADMSDADLKSLQAALKSWRPAAKSHA